MEVQKVEEVKKHRADGLTVTDACEKAGITTAAFYSHMNREKHAPKAAPKKPRKKRDPQMITVVNNEAAPTPSPGLVVICPLDQIGGVIANLARIKQ